MPSDFFEDLLFEVQRRWKRRILIPLLVIVGIVVLVVGGVGVAWLVSGRSKPPEVNSSDIPLGSYAAGNVEVLYCIYQGADECPEYDRSKEWMGGATGGSLTYEPLAGDTSAPGEDAGNGQRKVTDLQGLTDEEWHSIAAGMTLDGAANPGTVTENSTETTSFSTEEVSATATFQISTEDDASPRTGTMTFTLVDSGVVLKSLTYSGGE